MKGWQLFFWVAMAFNFAAGLPTFLAPDALLTSLGLEVPADLMFHRFTGLLVVCLGVVYGFVAQDLTRFRPLVWLGVVGKGGVVALFTEAWMAGRMPFQAYAISLGDLAFLAGFLFFLFTTRRNAT
ncbi:MAG: hypothetical protein HOP13_07285 [Alphaproteobacteria bacterium]|nr:hypothetical protein [Alphaproteobacteria bacterium]